jgi:hypothetical protein
MRNVVRGDAADSTLCAKPNTLHCFSYGTTFWMTVLSAASTNGAQMSQINIPIAIKTIDAWIVKKIHTVHVMILIINNVLSGFFHSPYLVINNPHAINARLSTHHNTHQVCTETSKSP